MITRILQGIALLITVSVIAGGAFFGGMLFHANVYQNLIGVPRLASGPSAEPPSAEDTNAPDMEVFWEAWNYLNDEFYGDLPQNSNRVHGAIRGMVATFDDQHTAFIDPVRSAIGLENMGGSFEGIGASIRQNESGQLQIVDPFPDRPAFLAGLRPNDFIIEIDGAPSDGLSLYEAVSLIRGPANTPVVLTIFREGELEPRDIEIVRARIEIEVVQTELIKNRVGHIRLTQFSDGASDKIKAAMNDLTDQGAIAIVLDLRSNPGGLLSEAIHVSSLFVDGDLVVERLKGGEEKIFSARDSHQSKTDIPLVVLVNGGSASASEIVAGAIQDKARALVMGEQTFGKSSVQIPHRLSDGGELRVTIAEWLTPNGRQINKVGVTPDIEVEMTIEDMDTGRDPQLDEAVNYLLNR